MGAMAMHSEHKLCCTVVPDGCDTQWPPPHPRPPVLRPCSWPIPLPLSRLPIPAHSPRYPLGFTSPTPCPPAPTRSLCPPHTRSSAPLPRLRPASSSFIPPGGWEPCHHRRGGGLAGAHHGRDAKQEHCDKIQPLQPGVPRGHMAQGQAGTGQHQPWLQHREYDWTGTPPATPPPHDPTQNKSVEVNLDPETCHRAAQARNTLDFHQQMLNVATSELPSCYRHRNRSNIPA